MMSTLATGKSIVRKILFAGEAQARRLQVHALRRELAAAERTNAALARKLALSGDTGAATDLDERVSTILGFTDTSDVAERIEVQHKLAGPKHYGAVWRQRLEVIRGVVVANGERKLSGAVARVRRTEERRRSMALEPRKWVVFDRELMLPSRAAAAAYRSAVVETVIDAVTPETTRIIETGSGWGEHLCNIYLEGGPADATYHALEYEKEGRQCAEVLAATEPQFKLRSAFFDYTAPDYTAVGNDDGHTVLLTAHSIEQVREIHPDTVYAALELSPRVSGIHFEPIGWQTQPEASWTETTRSHRQRCAEKKYNENLYGILRDAESRGRLRITNVVMNFIGLDHNPATLITWEKT